MKKIGIGYEFYKNFIDENAYYVDKTLLVKDVIEKGGKVTLFTRPRRFGKTLALSMLQTFFEQEIDAKGDVVDNSRYFEGMKIMNADEKILSKMGQYPVIKLSLKSAAQNDFYNSFMKLREEIIYEFERHNYIKAGFGTDRNKAEEYEIYEYGVSKWEERVKYLTTKEEKDKAFNEECGRFSTAIKTLSKFLKQHHGKNAIILIDEYDVPLENAYSRGYYEEMVSFIRSLFESALKTNDCLEFAVVTGCLRISKESIFTGLNNLEINSIRSKDFGEYFGFEPFETRKMLEDYGLKDNTQIVKDWYDGYLFGEKEVYNPWSLTKYVKEHTGTSVMYGEQYWSNTSSNNIIKKMIEIADDQIKDELDSLIIGGTIEKAIHEDITYDDIYSSKDNIWNFLYFTGYLKKVSEKSDGTDILITFCIPNQEVLSIYKTKITDWFDAVVKSEDTKGLHEAIKNGNAEAMGQYVSEVLSKSISFFDGEESFYHGFLLSLLYGMPGYSVKSNREYGDGRPDIVLLPDNPKNPAIIFELKIRRKYNEMDGGLDEAIKQIITQKYEDGILEEGYVAVVSFGVCFCRKSCVFRVTQG